MDGLGDTPWTVMTTRAPAVLKIWCVGYIEFNYLCTGAQLSHLVAVDAPTS